MSNAPEGTKKKCFKCQTSIVHVRVGPDKLQWQNEADGVGHYTFVSEKNYTCNLPTEATTTDDEIMLKANDPSVITPKSPFEEAELITLWASGKAYKMVMAEVTDINKLSVQEKSGLGQKEGMLTRLLTDTVLELMKINGIKSSYKAD